MVPALSLSMVIVTDTFRRSRMLTSPWCPIVAAVAGQATTVVHQSTQASSRGDRDDGARRPECRAMLPRASWTSRGRAVVSARLVGDPARAARRSSSCGGTPRPSRPARPSRVMPPAARGGGRGWEVPDVADRQVKAVDGSLDAREDRRGPPPSIPGHPQRQPDHVDALDDPRRAGPGILWRSSTTAELDLSWSAHSRRSGVAGEVSTRPGQPP